MAEANCTDIMAELLATADRLQHLLGRQELLQTGLLYGDRGTQASPFWERGSPRPHDVQTLVNHISTVLVRLTGTYRLNYRLIGSRDCLTPVPHSYVNHRFPVQETLEGSRGTMKLAVC
ncbi:uncharacterized protein [Haliotis asinina]|uniref:uncharacterized protein n=1 Tax=Haliotis asinina TaxID=109174 RepID=UPI003531E99E